jgi:hypothetical protein
MRDYVVDLLELLAEKAPLIEDALDELRDLVRDRAAAVHALHTAHATDLTQQGYGLVRSSDNALVVSLLVVFPCVFLLYYSSKITVSLLPDN